jgi:iron complex outermembrane receptor protein
MVLASGMVALPLHAAVQKAGLEEVLVTATKTGETELQSTPLAISAFTAAQLDARGVGNVKGLVDYTPGLQISDVNGYAQLYLRGVGSNNVYIGSDPSTTIHMDGVYLARPVAYFSDFLDVERVEVLRGPQGTLYGRNSVGGTINIISRKPTDTFSGQLQGLLGTYQEFGLKGYISGPIAQTPLRGSLSFVRMAHDGYMENVGSGHDIADQNSWGVRGQLYAALTDKLDVTLRADYFHSDDHAAGSAKLLEATGLPLEDSILGDYDKITADGTNRLQVRNYGLAADINYEINDNLSLKSLTAYRAVWSDDYTDADATNQPGTQAIFDLREHQFSEELNLNAKFDRLTLVTGAYYFRESDVEPANVVLPLAGFNHFQRPRLTAESYALYTQGEYRINDQFSVITGVRYTHETKDYHIIDFWKFSGAEDSDVAIQAPNIGAPFFSDPFDISASKNASAVTPKFGINYKPTEEMLIYASATRGFKSGGFDFGSTGPQQQSQGFGPEYLWSYEVGVKSQWLDDRLRVNLDTFYYDYKDLQVTLYTPPVSAYTQNAATAHVKGIEAEIVARPLPSIDLFANVAFLDAKYDDYPGAQVKAIGAFDASGKYLNNSPKWTLALGGTYTYQTANMGAIYVGADYHFQTVQYFSPANDGANGISGYKAKQGAYALVNARIGWRSDDELWDAALIGRNLSNREYITTATDYGGLGAMTLIGRPGAPRTATVQVSRKF